METIRSTSGRSIAWLRSHLAIFSPSNLTSSAHAHSAVGARSGQTSSSPPVIMPSDQSGVEDSDDYWQSNNDGLDGPWSFLTSTYALVLVIMAVLINRINHVCRPRGRPAVLRGWKRLMVRLPSVLFLTYVVLSLSLVTYHLFFPRSGVPYTIAGLMLPKSTAGFLLNDAPSPHTGTNPRDSHLLWLAFLSSCLALATANLVRNLEAARDEAAAFNLVGFAVLLHFHSTSTTFRPGKHVYLCVLLQSAEVWALELAGCWRRPVIPRLPLTSFFGLVSTAHYLLATRDGGYPFLQSFNRAPDVALMAIIAGTALLSGLTMLLSEGSIDPSRLLFTQSNLPSRHEDYSVALFKLGTACLESTRLSGLSRELTSLAMPMATWVEIDGLSGEAKVQRGVEHVDVGSLSSSEFLALQRRRLGGGGASNEAGFGTEIRSVRTQAQDADPGGAIISGASRWSASQRFFTVLWDCVKGLSRLMWRGAADRCPFTLPHLPGWMARVPRCARLLWHGQNGEARRAERIAREAEDARREAERREMLEGIVRAEMEAEQRGAGLAPAVEGRGSRAVSPALSSAGSVGRRSKPSSRAASPSSSLLDEALWRRFLAPQAPAIPEGDESGLDDDDEYIDTEDEDDEDAEDGASVQDEQSGYWAGAGQGQRLLQDSDGNDDVVDAEELGVLVQLAGREFEDGDGPTALTTSTSTATTTPFNQVLLAHLTSSPERGALTRRKFAELTQLPGGAASPSRGGGRASWSGTPTTSYAVGQQQQDEEARHLLRIIAQRRQVSGGPRAGVGGGAESGAYAGGGEAPTCVICLDAPRTIICWPCRCLSLCEECREALASRPPRGNNGALGGGGGRGAAFGGPMAPGGVPGGASSAGLGGRRNAAPTHPCPACRTPVQGFSRIYVP